MQAILATTPQDFPRKVETARVKGHYGNEIIVCRLKVNGRHKAERFLDRVWERLGASDRKMLYTGLDEYLDSVGTLHLRIDKQKALGGNISLGITDPVKVEISFRSRATEEPFVELVRKRISVQAEPVGPPASID